jgi:hypothetical protein
VSRLFRIILDVTSPAFNVEDRQWRSSVIDVFYYYFSAAWADEKAFRFYSRVWHGFDLSSRKKLDWRSIVGLKHCCLLILKPYLFVGTSPWRKLPSLNGSSLSHSLFNSIPISLHGKASSVPYNFTAYSFTPEVLSWDSIIEILLQDDYEQKNGENEDGPAAAHLVRLLIMFQLSIHRRLFQSMYGLSSSEVAEQSLNADPDFCLSSMLPIRSTSRLLPWEALTLVMKNHLQFISAQFSWTCL